MASVVYDITAVGADPWELIYLAGGDPVQSTYDSPSTTLTNTTVTQAALNQAVVDLAAGAASPIKQAETKLSTEATLSYTDLSLAILGDPTAIADLQAMVAQTDGVRSATLPSVPPTAGGGVTQVQDNYAATLTPTVADDSVAGYTAGSRWYDTNIHSLFICVDPTAGAAVWVIVNDSLRVLNINATASLTSGNQHIRADATLAPFTVTLPDALTMTGKTVTINKVDPTTNPVSIAALATQPVYGISTFPTGTLIPPPFTVQFSSLTLRSIGAGWDII